MGLLDAPKALLNVVKSVPARIFGIMGRVRDKIQQRVFETKAHKTVGPNIDRAILAPVAKVIGQLFGAGPIELAEGRIGAEKRAHIRKVLEQVERHAKAGAMTDDEKILAGDEELSRVHKVELDRITSLEPADETIERRTFLRVLNRSINRSRSGPAITLLSSGHKLTTLANKLALHVYQSKSEEVGVFPEAFRYLPVVRGGKSSEHLPKEKEKGRVNRHTWFGKKPRLDASRQVRKDAVEAPVLSKDKKQYEVQLNEPYKKFFQKSREQHEKRKAFTPEMLTLSVSLGEKGYPKNGDPTELYEVFYQKYAKTMDRKDFNQMAFGMHQAGNRLVLVGLITKDRVETPETMEEPLLPIRFNDQYWYEKIPEPDRVEGSLFARLMEDEGFPGDSWDIDNQTRHLPRGYKGYTIWQFYRMHKTIMELKKQGYDIDITGVGIRSKEFLLGQSSPCLHISIRINGKAETFKLAFDVLEPPQEYVLAKAGKKDASSASQIGLRVDQFLEKLTSFEESGDLEKKLKQVSGDQAPAPPDAPPPSLPETPGMGDIIED